MTEDDIRDAIKRYARVAHTARDCGFTGVQVHSAHGYLISQFLSPRANHRSDDWGGSLENRARFLLETVAAVRQAVGDEFPVGVKLNSSDFQKGGFSADECCQVASWLDQAGVDLLEISGGTYEQPQLFGHTGLAGNAEPPKRESTRLREAYFLEYARNIQQAINMPLMVTGGFRTRAVMLAALDSGEADCIGLARPLCVDTDLPTALMEGTLDAAQSYETEINLGHGFFGPTSPLLLFKIINIQGEVAWFYRQIVRLSEGKGPDRSLGMLRALVQHMRNERRVSRRRTFRS
jgi:2,4-dienoyl-CoA reductase-like NADH-dependent reductase (Old Yellow Enzyme family)